MDSLKKKRNNSISPNNTNATIQTFKMSVKEDIKNHKKLLNQQKIDMAQTQSGTTITCDNVEFLKETNTKSQRMLLWTSNGPFQISLVFGSFFEGILTFVGNLMPKPYLEKNHNRWNNSVHTFPKGISPKVNVVAGLKFELPFYDATVLHIYCFLKSSEHHYKLIKWYNRKKI